MRHLFSICLLVIIGFAAPVTLPGEGKTDTIDIFLILKKLSTINNSLESNQSVSSSSGAEISDQYAEKKSALLNRLSTRLQNGSLTADLDLETLEQEHKKLAFRIDANQKLGYHLAVSRDLVQLDILKLKKMIREFIVSLASEIRRGSDLETLNALIQKETTQLNETIKPDKYAAILQTAESGGIRDDLLHNYEELTALYAAYSEMLGYLQQYRSEISRSSLLNELDLYALMDWVDRQVPLRLGVLTAGNLTLVVVIMLFFFSIRRLIAQIMAWLLDRYLWTHEDTQVHAYFVKAIQSPISWLLIAYSIELSLEVIAHPEPLEQTTEQWMLIIYILLATWMMIKLISVYGEYLSSQLIRRSDSLRREVINMFKKLAYFAVFIVALLAIFRALEYNISAIVASLGIGGLAVALAAKDTLANFFASIMILLDNSFSQGDWIECNGIEGTVVEIGLRQTTIRTFDNALLFVPNSKLADNNIRNWNRRKVGRRIKMHVTLTYDSPRENLKQCVEDIRTMLKEHPGIANPDKTMEEGPLDPVGYKSEIVSRNDLHGYKSTLMVYLDQLNSCSIDILIYCFSTTVNWEEWLKLKEDVLFKIMEIVENNELSFAFPSQSVYVESLPPFDSANREA